MDSMPGRPTQLAMIEIGSTKKSSSYLGKIKAYSRVSSTEPFRFTFAPFFERDSAVSQSWLPGRPTDRRGARREPSQIGTACTQSGEKQMRREWDSVGEWHLRAAPSPAATGSRSQSHLPFLNYSP